MPRVEFVVDNFGAARAFVKSLPKRVREARFATDKRTKQPLEWAPDHVVLARVGTQLVAMADAITSPVASAANVSLVALPGFGALAVRCLHRLKSTFPVEHWEATLRAPAASTLKIAYRYLDAVHDHIAWELSQDMASTIGKGSGPVPPCIAATQPMLRRMGLRGVEELDVASCGQLLNVAQLPTDARLVCPNGYVVGYADALTLVFEVLGAPVPVRQSAARMTVMTELMRISGRSPDPTAFQRFVDIEAFGQLLSQIDKARKSLPTTAASGYFTYHPPSIGFNMRAHTAGLGAFLKSR